MFFIFIGSAHAQILASGKVLMQDGTPVPGAVVSVYVGENQKLSVKADSNGVFILTFQRDWPVEGIDLIITVLRLDPDIPVKRGKEPYVIDYGIKVKYEDVSSLLVRIPQDGNLKISGKIESTLNKPLLAVIIKEDQTFSRTRYAKPDKTYSIEGLNTGSYLLLLVDPYTGEKHHQTRLRLDNEDLIIDLHPKPENADIKSRP